MSIENVKSFYARLAIDEAFRTQIQGVNSKAQCSQIVKAAGYDFTQEEYEKYTAQLLESDFSDSSLQDLDDKELEAIMGGISSIIGHWKNMQQPYGVVEPPFAL